MSGPDVRGRTLALAMTLCFVLMLGASLYKRFTQPELVLNRFASVQAAEAAPDMGEMDAIGRLMQEVAAHPKDKEAVLRLVESLMSMGQWESAENFAQKALALEGPDSADPRPLYLLALIHHNQGRHAQAAELLENLLEKSETAPARYSLGILYLHYLNKPQRGIEHLQKGLAAKNLSKSLEAAMREELGKAAGFEEGPRAVENEAEDATSSGAASESQP